jgi:hypothetical protein
MDEIDQSQLDAVRLASFEGATKVIRGLADGSDRRVLEAYLIGLIGAAAAALAAYSSPKTATETLYGQGFAIALEAERRAATLN